jgi:hypothetical protein
MALSTYEDLQAAVLSWTHREGDSTIAAIVPDCIRLAEVRMNRVLRVSAMEADFPTTALVNGAASLPTGFLAFKEVRYVGDANYTLQPKPLEWIRAQTTNTGSAASYFALTGSQIVCWPESGSIRGTYYTEIPALADNSTNWLLTAHPDLYLFAALTELALWMVDDSRIPLWAEKASALLDAVQRADDRNLFDGGPLAARAR